MPAFYSPFFCKQTLVQWCMIRYPVALRWKEWLRFSSQHYNFNWSGCFFIHLSAVFLNGWCNSKQLITLACFWTWSYVAWHDIPLLTNIPVVGVCLHLHLANDVPDAGHPVGQQGEHGHEQRQHHRAVLRVAVHFLEQTQQPEQTDCFQEVDHGHLEREKEWAQCWDASGDFVYFNAGFYVLKKETPGVSGSSNLYCT